MLAGVNQRTTALPPRDTLLGWVRDGQRRAEEVAAGLPAAAVAEPSELPGWSRGHVLTHLARNADALVNLLTWARTGERRLMYASREQRDADIEAGAGRDHAEQVADLRGAGQRFDAAVAAMTEDSWAATVLSGQGREIPAEEVPLLRARELWLHLVDLRAGVGMAALPAELAFQLVRDVAGWMSSKVDSTVQLVVEGYGAVVLGSDTADGTLTGPPYALAGWLTGRSGLDQLTRAGRVPELPRWL